MKIGIVGMGLIGGSLCRAVKQYTQHRVYGMTRNPATVQFALSAGAIDEELTHLGDMDLTIVALPPEATADFLTKHVGDFQKGAIVTDVCGVKQFIVDTADQLYFDAGVHYIGGHPMAGKETAGFANSDADLYKGASFIVTPTALTSQTALETVKDLMLSIGFTRIATATPAEHDANIAYTSQLAHVVSSAYIKSPTLAKELGFSAGSFQDMTRVAKLDPDMWTSLFRLNREPLLFEINTLISNLTKFRDRLAADDVDAIHDSLNLGRVLKENVMLRQHKS
jgi:prephenate dehydrogenase